MDIKKTAIKDVFKIGKEDYSGLYKELDRLLGEENPFAQFKIGAGQYVWSDIKSDRKWHEMEAEASGFKEEQIRSVMVELRSRMTAKIPEKIVGLLFTVPDNSFIFYNEDGGDLRVMLTGWGFRKPVAIKNGPEVTKVKQHTPVDISFIYDGERLKSYEFGIRLCHQVKKLVTTAESGIYRFENINVGERYQLIDIKSDRTFDFAVESGKTHYEFDLTAYATISVHADLDSAPLVGEPMKIDYHGNVECPQTDASGNAKLRVVYHEGEEVLVVMRGKRQAKTIESDDTAFAFAFEGQPEPMAQPEEPEPPLEPEPSVDPEPEPVVQAEEPEEPVVSEQPTDEPKTVVVQVIVCKSGEPIYGILSSVDYSGSRQDGLTSVNGKWECRVDYREGELCHVEAQGYDPQERELEADGENLFMFDCEDEVEPERISLTVVDEKSAPMSGARVTIRQNGKQDINVVLDEQGKVEMDKSLFTIGETVYADIHCGNFEYTDISFTVDADENEYLLQQQNSHISGGGTWNIVKQVLAVIAAVLVMVFVIWPLFAMLAQAAFESIYG